MQKVVKSYKGYPPSKPHGIRCEINRPKGKFVLHSHDYFEFELIKRGVLSHELNGNKEILRVGDAVALSPKDLHRFTVLEPVEIYNVCIYYEDAPSSVAHLLSAMQFPLRRTLSEEALDSIAGYFHHMSEAIKKKEPFERERVAAYALLFLTELFSAKEVSIPKDVLPGYTHIAHAMDFIATNFTLPLSLEEVANQVHLTPSYFSKLFSVITGDSFVHYLAAQRIQYAKLLLTTTEKSVTEIAFEVGFNSFSSFSRTFQRLCHVTPSDYRKHAQR